MNNIIGNTPYRNIQNKKYIDSTAEYIGKLADFLDKEQIPYSGRISEYKSTITVSGDENFKRASEILDKIKAENPRRFIGNTQYKYIRDKRIISMDADVVDKIAARLDSEHIMYSGIVEGEKGRITVSGSELEALVKGYIELERNGNAEIAYEIALTSDAYDDIYYICDQNGNAYYDEDGFAPTFNHVDDAERYAQIHHIPITVDETLMNHWREIEHTDKIRHDNSELVASFPKSGEEYPDHFLYNAEGKSFQWIYYNPDGNFGEGEFVQKNIYEQDIIAAYNAKITSPDEATGRNEFIYSLFSSCEETVISSDTEAFTAMAKEYINKPTGTIELYGIVENGTNISSIDMLISALEENCPAVHSEKEKTEEIVITENSDEIIIDGYEGTWYVVDTETVDGKELFLLENEEYGDETFGIIIDKDRNVLVGEVWNGFSDYHEKYDNITPEEKLANKVEAEWKAFLDDMKNESPAVLIESAYEISTKDNIQTYITEENLDLSEKQINALLSSPNTLNDLYNDWSSDEYLNSYSDVAELLKITADKLSEAIDRENLMLFRKENRECTNMIEALAAKHYEDNSFNTEAALDELLEKYSFERIQTIAAANVVELYGRLHDGRIDRNNYEWAKNVIDALPEHIKAEMQPVGSNRLTMHTGLIDLLTNRVREYEAKSLEKEQEQPTPERTAEDIAIGDRYRYKGADVEVVSMNGIYPNDVGISKNERMGNSEYAVTSNVDKYELHRNGQYLGNGEKTVVSELDIAKKYIEDYLDSEFSSEADFSDMKHISIGYTEIGSEEQGDHSLQMEADLENLSVSYFIDDELAKTEHYNSLEQMNREHLSVLNFEDMLNVGTTELDRILEEKTSVKAVLAVSQYDTDRYYIANDITEEAVRNAIANSDKLFMELCALGGTQITEVEFAQYSQTEGIAAIDVNIDEQTMHIYGADEPIVSFKEIKGIDEISDALDLENNVVGSITEPTPEQREEITRKNNTLNSFFNNNPLAVFREIVKSAGLEPTEDISIGDTKEIFNSLKSVDISIMGYTYSLEFEPHDDRLSVTNRASGRTSEFLLGHVKELMYLIANENNISRENLIYNEVMRGTGFEDGKFRVADFYQANPSKKDFADFLKNEYGIGGHSSDGPVKFADHDSKGIEITLTTGKENFTWNDVAKIISELIEKGEYITQKDIDDRIRRAKLTIDNANEHTDSPEGKSAIKSKYTITNEKNSYMIVDDVRHAIDELSNGSDDEYDWAAFLTAYKSVMEANVQSDIALPLYKSGADKILSKANSNDTETISKSDYQNALACLDMVLKNGHLLKNPEEKEIEQFSFFSPRSNYISTDEIKPINVSHKNTEKENPITSKQDSITFSQPDSVNFTISESTFSNLGGDKTRCQNNIAAIRLLKQIEGEKRSATPDEQQILAKYIGWGGLANAFDSSKTDWSKEYAELKTLLAPEEYSSARSSTLNAHYTSYTIISSIYSALDNMGFKGGKILEPALGTGNFFGSMPEEMRNNSQLSGVELDSITGRIAKLLYPSANIQIKGYEDTNFENNSFDVAVSNVPFGSYKVNDKEYNKQNMLIHDYFFSKTLDKVRPGGIIAFVTSKGTLDKENSEVRKYLAERAELLGAIRLPNTAFKNNAGTEVTSDIIFLQKREKPISVEQNTPDWVFKDILDNGIAVNKYFADHPEMILGQMAEGNKMFGNGTTCVPFDGAVLKEQLAAAIQNIRGEYNKTVKSVERENASHAETVSCPPDAPKYSYVISDDKLYYHKAGDTMELVDAKDTDRIKAMTQLRDGVHELLDLQINNYNGDNEVKISEAQNKLSKDYDDFVEHFGRIGQAENKRAFANDNSYHLIKSLEKTDNGGNFVSKADIFSKKTINPQVVVDHCNNAQDALILSLSEKMRVDMDYMLMLTDKSESELVAELGDKIYQNPQKNMRWESADEYLTGNIRAKLAAAEEAGLERNIEALRAVMPQRIEAADISVKLGSAWIDPEYIRQFILETLKPDFQTRNSIEVIYSEATDKWKVDGYQHSYGNTLATETYGTSDMNAYEIIEVSLNMKKAEIRERVKDENGIEIKDEKGRYVLAVNQDKTMVVQSKQDELKKKFKDWIFATPERREKLTNLYNEKFNSVRLREYDGSHLNFVGMNSNIALKPHQKNAVARSLYSNGNTLIAHEVGAGKTFEMVAIAMEGKRLGLHSKPLITAPNALTEQWGDAFRTLYPNSNVLVATEKDFKPENRRDLFAKIATGDWDAVIIGHSQFDMIHLSRERELETLYSEVDKLEAALDEISATSNKGSYSVKQVERAIKSYTDKIQKLLEKTPKEDMLCFEQLGIDKIFVDESQAYKNLDTPTKMQNVSGIGSGGSGRAMQLLMKCRYLDEVTGGKGVVFASGTPISNSMSEMYTLMRYLQADKLRELGINSFDRWASIFGETTTSMELSPEANGKYQMKTRFAKFQNLPELMNIFKECADIKTAATLNLDRPDFGMHNINVPATKMQSKMIKNLGERAKIIRAGAVDPTEDNMCKLTVDGRKIGLDQRCMNPSLPDDPNSKVNVCINNVFDIWKQTAEKKSTQLIFCDLATPQAAVNENTYTLYRKDTKGEYAPVYSAKLGQKDTADKIFKKLTGSKPPKNFKAGGVFDEDIIMIHTVDYDTMTASNSAVIASSGKISEIPEETWSKLHHSPTETFESERKFCVYDDIKQKLVAKGVPEKEIAFIHDADTTEEKQKLFAKMNKGEIRVMIGSTQKCGAGMNAQERMIALHDLDAPMRPSDMEQRHGRIIRQGNTNTKVDIYRYTTDKTFDAYLYQMLENKQKFISQIMTDKSPVRSCEDVDEIALDYAEVKALCAGNPLIKEKIDLETEITKLNVLKSSFLSQKYAVQDKAYTILPREKSVKELYIDKLKKDVEFSEKEQPLQNEDGKNYYPVMVGDNVYNEKDAAGEAIRQAILDNKDILHGKESHIGTYRGFEMTAFLDVFSKKIKVNLKNETNHYGELNMDSNVKAGGNIIRLDNVINSIGITLMKEEERLQAICADIEQAKAAADAVFPQEQELAAKEKRLEEVNAQLASTDVSTQDRSSELYAALVDICPALQYSKEFYCKYEAEEGIEPLYIERNGDVVFVAHTYTQNGDLMYDPAIEFSFDSENQKADALSYELSGMGMYQDFRDGNLPNDKADVEEMVLETMFVNIKDYDYKLIETNIDTEIDEDERCMAEKRMSI